MTCQRRVCRRIELRRGKAATSRRTPKPEPAPTARVKRLAYEVSSAANPGYVERVQEEIVTAAGMKRGLRAIATWRFRQGDKLSRRDLNWRGK